MNRKGFTLIELMLVMGILGVVAAIAIPKFKEIADKAACRDKGNAEACDRVAALDARRNGTKVVPMPAVDLADNSKWEVVRGKVMSVQYTPAGSNLKDRWYVVVKQSDGTIRNAMLGKPAVADVEACIALSPDEEKFFDDLVQCK